MTRRRFFPSTPVQAVPGQSVQLEVKLQPSGPAPAPSSGPTPTPVSEPTLPSWVSPELPIGKYSYEQREDGRWELSCYEDISLWFLNPLVFEGEPFAWLDGAQVWPDRNDQRFPAGIVNSGWRLVDIGVPPPYYHRSVFAAAGYGPRAKDLTWSWSWSDPSSVPDAADCSYRVVSYDHVCYVILTASIDEPPTNTLTATAFLDGIAVGSLVLRIALY